MATADGGAYRRVFVVYELRCSSHSLNPISYSLTVFSPSGKLVQIEHALAAVSQGTTSLGIKGVSLRSIHMLQILILKHYGQHPMA